VKYNFAQNCPASLQIKIVFPCENNQGKETYAIFGDAAAMLRHGGKNCCVGCPEKLRASIDNNYFTKDIKIRGRDFIIFLMGAMAFLIAFWCVVVGRWWLVVSSSSSVIARYEAISMFRRMRSGSCLMRSKTPSGTEEARREG
jgi:hypothetical protein